MFVIVPALLAGYHRARGRRRTDARAPSRLRALIRRRPITSFLIIAYVGMWTCLVPAFVLDGSYRLLTAVGALVGLAAPALVITQLCDGRGGLLDLLRRAIRWRVRPWWHLFALYAIPVGAVLVARLLWGPADPDASGLGGVRLVVVFTGQVLLALITIQLLEELAWTGFVQHRLQGRHGHSGRAC